MDRVPFGVKNVRVHQFIMPDTDVPRVRSTLSVSNTCSCSKDRGAVRYMRHTGSLQPAVADTGWRKAASMHRTPNPTAVVALVCIFVAAPLAMSSHAGELIPMAAIGAATAIFWRPVQAWSRRFEGGEQHLSDTTTTRRLAALEHQVEAMRHEQTRLRETVHWQEQLLHQSVEKASLSNGSPKQ